jgi:hypothetical protein
MHKHKLPKLREESAEWHEKNRAYHFQWLPLPILLAFRYVKVKRERKTEREQAASYIIVMGNFESTTEQFVVSPRMH